MAVLLLGVVLRPGEAAGQAVNPETQAITPKNTRSSGPLAPKAAPAERDTAAREAPTRARSGQEEARRALPTWMVNLDNRGSSKALTLQVSRSTRAGLVTQAPRRYRFRVPARQNLAVQLRCGVDFIIVPGGTATNAAATIHSPSGCSGGGTSARVELGQPTWTVNLDNRGNSKALTLRVSRSTRAGLVAQAPRRFRVPAGQNLAVQLRCGVNFIIVPGGTAANTAGLAASSPSGCSGGGTSARIELGQPTWTVNLDNRANAIPLTLQVTSDTARGIAEGQPGYNRDTRTFTVAAGQSLPVQLHCGVKLDIDRDNPDMSAALNRFYVPAPPRCTAATPAKQLLLYAYWRIRVDNGRNVSPVTLVISDETERYIWRLGVPEHYAAESNTFTLAGNDGEFATMVYLRCGTDFEITGGTALNRESIPSPASCGREGVHVVRPQLHNWTVNLDNRGGSQSLTLQISRITVEEGLVEQFPDSYRFRVPARQNLAVAMRCGVDFIIVPGGTATNAAETIPSPGACLAGGSSSRVELGSPIWTVTLDNRANAAALTLQVEEATELGLAGNFAGHGYNASTNTFTIPAGGSIPLPMACGVDFTIVPGGTATNAAATIPSPDACRAGGSSSRVELGSPTWTVNLDNRANAAALTLQVEEATELGLAGDFAGHGYNASTNTFTIPAGGSIPLPMACGVDFTIVPGGTATNAAATIPSPGACLAGGSSSRVELGSPIWTVNLDNRANAAALTLQVEEATELGLAGDFAGHGYDASTNTFTIPAGGSIPLPMACGVDFTIVPGGTATNAAATIPSPGACLAGGSSSRVELGSPTWTVNLDNRVGSQALTLQVSRSTAAGLVGQSPSSYRFRVPAGQNLAVAMRCGVDFTIVPGGTATNAAATLPSPDACLAGGTSAAVALTGKNIFRPAAFDLADRERKQFTYNVARAGARVFVYTSGAGFSPDLAAQARPDVEIRVTDGAGGSFSGGNNLGVGQNAVLAFTARVAGAHTLTVTNTSGFLASGLTLTARTVPPVTTGAQAISLSFAHACFVLGGGAYCVGDNLLHRLGEGENQLQSSVDRVALLHPVFGLSAGVTAISAGFLHTCAIHETGGNAAAKCWGGGSPVAQQVSGLSAGVTAISAGGSHTCAIHETGGNAAAKCWRVSYAIPQQVSGLSAGVTAISAGGSHTCAIHETAGNAAAKCWGSGGSGQLGNGRFGNRNTPQQVSGLTSGVTAISAGGSHTCAIHETAGNAAAKCWGTGARLGNGRNSGPSSTPQQVSGLTSGVTAISAGWQHTCAIHDDGSAAAVKCWGTGAQLGNGSHFSSSSNVPVTASLPQGFVPATLSAGYYAEGTCAISSAGEPLCWGEGLYGQLGNGSYDNQGVPMPVYNSSGFDRSSGF